MNKAKVLMFALPDFGTSVLEILKNSINTDIMLVLPTLASDQKHPYYEIIPKAEFYETQIEFHNDLEEEKLLDKIDEFEPHFIVTATYTKKIPDLILEKAPIGLNIHFSLLPYYRGYDPIFWTIRNGEKKGGYTIHALNSEFDRGEIFGKYEIPIKENENSYSFYKKIVQQAPLKLVSFLKAFMKGKNLKASAQPQGKFLKAPRVSGRDLKINWNLSINDIDLLVRAAYPNYGALTNFLGERIQVWTGKKIKEDTSRIGIGNLVKYKGELGVSAKDGIYLIGLISAFDNNAMKFSEYVNRVQKNSEFF